ncbi:hypothetical protein DY000_02035954 [Brassica cretica]|uniref:DUF223 domain-containing protein n=1 Tax=Brassica cretica TaxID=69181 RepID=A0ABQ7DI53_BRACR|nr:hypothetical protein DY000_02035954 [Brassica cretica]
MFLSASLVPQTGVPAFVVTQPSNYVIHGFTPVGRANHYMSSLKAGSFGFLRLWDSLNFKKNKEFVGITVLFLDEKKIFLSASPVPQTGVPASVVTQPSNYVIHGFTPVGRANHYMSSLKAGSFGFLRLWDSLNFKKNKEFVGITVLFLDEKVNSVIHGFTPVGRANHYMPSLKAGSIVKVNHFEVARCSSMYKITDHPFLIRFISLTIIDEVITSAPEIDLQSRLDCSTISK